VRRDHVLIGALAFESFALSTLRCRLGSTYGPFLSERPIVFLLEFHGTAIAPDQYKPIREFPPVTRPIPLGEQTPRRGQVLTPTATLGLTLTATIGVIDRVANHASRHRSNSQMPSPTSLAQYDILPLSISHLPDRGEALFVNPSNFPRGQSNLGVAAISRHQRRMRTCRTNHLSTAPREKLDIVNRQSNGDVRQRKCIPGGGRGRRTTHHRITHPQSVRTENIGPLGIHILDQRKTSRSIRIVFDRNHLRHNTNLAAAEINRTNLSFVTTTPRTDGDAAMIVSPASPLLRKDEGLLGTRLRNVRKIFHRDITGRRRERPKCFHELVSVCAGRLSSRIRPSLPLAWGSRLSAGLDPIPLHEEAKRSEEITH